jgi:hypothetical protein
LRNAFLLACLFLTAGCETSLDVLDRAGRCTQTLAVGLPVEPARAADGFVDAIGLRVNMNYLDTPYANRTQTLTWMGALGSRHVIDLVDPTRTEIIDTFTRMKSLGMRGTLALDGDEDVPAISRAYGDVIETFKINRGPTWRDPLPIAEMRLAAAAVAAAVRALPAPRPMLIGPDVDDQDIAALGDLGPFVDYGVFHAPLGPEPPAGITLHPEHPRLDQALADRKALFGSKPFISIGIGYDTSGSVTGVSEAVQTKYVARLLLENFRRGVVRTYLFGLYDFLADSNIGWYRMGLIRLDGTPKPSFTVVQNLIALLKDPDRRRAPGGLPLVIDAPGATAAMPVRHLLLQKEDGGFYLALWLGMASGDADVNLPVSVRVGVPLKEVTAFSLRGSGGGTALVPVGDRVSLEVSDMPVILRIAPDCVTP